MGLLVKYKSGKHKSFPLYCNLEDQRNYFLLSFESLLSFFLGSFEGCFVWPR